MKDLYRCLDEYAASFLQAIATAWQIPLPKSDAHDMAFALAQAMLVSRALPELLPTLSPGAQQALAEIVAEGGLVPGHRLVARYGGIRRLGPAAIEREQPWLAPANPVEELYYRGLIYRTYGAVGDYTGEVFLVPEGLLERVVPLLTHAPRVDLATVAPPALIQADGDQLVEDLFAFLVRIRLAPPPVSWGREPLAEAAPDLLGLDQRLLGERAPQRVALIRRLLSRLRLTQESRGRLYPTPRAREWLRLPDLHRAWSVYTAWLNDRRWNELAYLSALNLAQSRLSADSNAPRARHALVQMLLQCPPEMWVSLHSFVQVARHLHPDYLRPGGDYDSWQIRDAATGEQLAGLGYWDRIEGALARQLVLGPLRWLGIVDVGQSAPQDDALAIRLTAPGLRLITAQGHAPEPEEVAAPEPLATIDEDYVVHIAVRNSLYARYQLERLAEWQGQDDRTARYHITVETLWASHSAGVKIHQVLSFLQRISQDRVPAAVARSLQAWGGRFGRVLMRRAVLLEAIDEETMRLLRAQREVRGLLGQQLSPTSCLVDEDKADELTAKLKEIGIWPHLRI